MWAGSRPFTPTAVMRGTAHPGLESRGPATLCTLSFGRPSPSPGTSSVDRCCFVLIFGCDEWAGQVLEQSSQTSLWPPSKRGCTSRPGNTAGTVHPETHETGIRGHRNWSLSPAVFSRARKIDTASGRMRIASCHQFAL